MTGPLHSQQRIIDNTNKRVGFGQRFKVLRNNSLSGQFRSGDNENRDTITRTNDTGGLQDLEGHKQNSSQVTFTANQYEVNRSNAPSANFNSIASRQSLV